MSSKPGFEEGERNASIMHMATVSGFRVKYFFSDNGGRKMIKFDPEKMYEEKKEFVQRVKLALKFDKRSDVEDIYYEKFPNLEVVTIVFYSGEVAKINVNANSCGAIFREIAAEVYGDGAFGRMHT